MNKKILKNIIKNLKISKMIKYKIMKITHQ